MCRPTRPTFNAVMIAKPLCNRGALLRLRARGPTLDRKDPATRFVSAAYKSSHDNKKSPQQNPKGTLNHWADSTELGMMRFQQAKCAE